MYELQVPVASFAHVRFEILPRVFDQIIYDVIILIPCFNSLFLSYLIDQVIVDLFVQFCCQFENSHILDMSSGTLVLEICVVVTIVVS